MPPKLSTWKAKHRECQAAVDNVKAHHLAKIEELEAENADLRTRRTALEQKISSLSTA